MRGGDGWASSTCTIRGERNGEGVVVEEQTWEERDMTLPIPWVVIRKEAREERKGGLEEIQEEEEEDKEEQEKHG
jgi:hypothetical protein